MQQSYRRTCSFVSSKDILSSISFFLFLSSSSFSFCSIILSTSSSSEIKKSDNLSQSAHHQQHCNSSGDQHEHGNNCILVKIIYSRILGSPCLFRSLSLIMCLCKARAMALDSLGLSRRAGMMVGIGGASCRDVRKMLQH